MEQKQIKYSYYGLFCLIDTSWGIILCLIVIKECIRHLNVMHDGSYKQKISNTDDWGRGFIGKSGSAAQA